MSKARDLASLLSGSGTGTISPALVSDQDNTSIGHFDVPAGTTAQRPASPNVGYFRFNTTIDQLEQYTSSGWQGISAPPLITSTNVTNFEETDTSQVLVITGANFDGGVTATLVDANGTTKNPTSSVRNSNSQVTITYSGGDVLTGSTAEPLDVKIINGSGLSYILEDQITIDATPIWSTTAGTLATINDITSGTHATLSATDPEGQSVSYTITSGSLPAGVSLNSSTGVISGNPTNVTASTTSNFTATADDGTGNTVNRSFSMVVTVGKDGTTSARAFTNPNDTIGYASSGTATLYTSIYGQITPFQTLVSFANASAPKYRTSITASQMGGATIGSGASSNTGGETTLISGSGNGCSQGSSSAYNWYGATAACMKRGARLCTKTELEDGASVGSGCSHDSRAIWTSTKNGSGQYYIQEGATSSNNQYRSPSNMSGLGSFVPSYGEVGIRCCAPTSGTNDWFV
jgi:hypothetical protein